MGWLGIELPIAGAINNIGPHNHTLPVLQNGFIFIGKKVRLEVITTL